MAASLVVGNPVLPAERRHPHPVDEDDVVRRSAVLIPCPFERREMGR